MSELTDLSDQHVSIGRVKRDISELVNRVAYGGERVVLTSRGKPKAAIVSLADYELIKKLTSDDRRARFERWLEKRDRWAAGVMERRGGEPIDVEGIWEAARRDLEERHDYLYRD